MSEEHKTSMRRSLTVVYSIFTMIWFSWFVYAIVVISFPKEPAVVMALYSGMAFTMCFSTMVWAAFKK